MVNVVTRAAPMVNAVTRAALTVNAVVSGAAPMGNDSDRAALQATEATGSGARFDPAAWLAQGRSTVRHNDASGNLAWGVGRHLCAGQHLATVELVLLLALLGRSVAAIDIDADEAERDFAPFLYPTQLPVRLTPREPVATRARRAAATGEAVPV